MKTPPSPASRSSFALALALLAAIGAMIALWPRNDMLTVYCAHDSIFAEKILRDFERHTGIHVAVRYDTEATKSLGLVELILQEAPHPRCDVFWNNELLGTLELADRHLLQPYKGPGYDRIPVALKDPAGLWTGFAARLRVIIANTERSGTNGVIAKPLYGTTRTHCTVLWQENGAAWVRDWRRSLREVNGNAMVKDLVASGVCAWGYTDTDDFFEARDAGKPVAMKPVRLDSGATICIPNTVAIVSGTQHQEQARRLVDFLLSEQTELALARSASRQIPLGPVREDDLPAEVRELQRWAADAYPLAQLGRARIDCLAWIKSEYLE